MEKEKEKELAAELMREAIKLNEQINIIAHLIENAALQGATLITRRNIANMMAASDENLFRPILKVRPELEPNK